MKWAVVLALSAALLGWHAGRGSGVIDAQHGLERASADRGSEAGGTVFDRDPSHPWNRLHHLLYSRATTEGKPYGQEGLEPPFLPTSRFLIEGPSHHQALTLLDEFLSERADERIKDPVRRAILQRDLWAVFSTTVGDATQSVRIDGRNGQLSNMDRFVDSGDAAIPAEQRPRRRELQGRLVQIMRRIALSSAEIDALPDNLARAAESGVFPRAFDPSHPGAAFLPLDLLARDGPWVAVSNAARAAEEFLAAPEHVRFTKGRSAFGVFLRLPEGRRATEVYLKKLQEGGTLQFPAGTQTALLRRMLLIDDSGTLRESPLTEELQIRAYHELDAGIPYAFTLHRGDLFAGRAGGLHAIGKDETSYFSFQTRGSDVFELPQLPPAGVILQTCTRCHSRIDERGGIHTVNTMYSRGEHGQIGTGLRSTELSDEARMTIRWTQETYTWGLLQGLWSARRE